MDSPAQHLLAEQLAKQIFPQRRSLLVSRVETGVSTWVYRITQDDAVYYLRILPEENASFAPEVYVHAALIARNLHVPEIVYYEHYHEAFQRSVLVTTAIAGSPVLHQATLAEIAPVLRQAGRELALLNQLPVSGFGWVQRDRDKIDEVRGEYTTCVTWMEFEIEQALAVFEQQKLLSTEMLARLRRLLADAIAQFSTDLPTLAHGDFDCTHIFHLHGAYTGMIDFGEIRGTHHLYDLGHFAIENAHLLPALLEGYQEISPLALSCDGQIRQAALLIAVTRMGRRAARHASVLPPDRRLIEESLSG